MSRIFWDSNLFIYLLEDYPEFSQAVANLRQKMLERGDQLLTSALTVGEVLVKPSSVGDLELCRMYEDMLGKAAIVLPFDGEAARRYATIRHDRSVKAPDAIQLACASEAVVDLFVTNDRRLQGKRVEGIQFIVALDQVPI
ncbi:MAG: type II toxin-antitoxin system VapC family toxin [Terriglobales bacterium]